MYTEDGNSYNRFVNLDGMEYRIVDFLAHSESKYADYLWKILRYDSEDCLHREFAPELDKSDPDYYEKLAKERLKLLYTNNGDASVKRVFLSPYIDDAWTNQTSHLHIYIKSVVPHDHLSVAVNIGIECITHNKICNIYGDADEFNDQTNPSEINGDKVALVKYKSRVSVMLKSILADLNGTFVAGVGMLQFNAKLSDKDRAELKLWNNRTFFGYDVVLSTLISGVSNNNNCGW